MNTGTHDPAALVAGILNAAYMVRHYARGARQRSSPAAAKRADAIRALGVIVRDAFNSSEEFEVLLGAVVDGLRPRDEPPF